MRKLTIDERRGSDVDSARRMLLKAGVYAGPAILTTALTAQNVYASGGHEGGDAKTKP